MLLDDKLRGKIGATCVTIRLFYTCSVRFDLVSFIHFDHTTSKRLLEPAFILIDCSYLSASSSGTSSLTGEGEIGGLEG